MRSRTEFLRFYASRLNTVELNSTFRRLPAEEQFERWADADRARLQVRGDARPPRDLVRPRSRAWTPPRGSSQARRPARSGADQGAAGARRRLPPPAARLTGARRCAGRSTSATSRGSTRRFRRDSTSAASPASMRGGRRRLPLPAPPQPALRDDDAGRRSGADTTTARSRASTSSPTSSHEDEPTAPRYAERLLELVSGPAGG